MAWIVDQQGDHVVRAWLAFNEWHPYEAACTCGERWRRGTQQEIERDGHAHCAISITTAALIDDPITESRR